MAKFIYSSTLENLQANSTLCPKQGEKTTYEGIDKEIAITGDGYFITHKKIFQMVNPDNVAKFGKLQWSGTNLELYLGGVKANSVAFNILDLAVVDGNNGILSLSKSNGTYTIGHKAPATSPATATDTYIGGTSTTNNITSVVIPKLQIDKYGHIIAKDVTDAIVVNKVYQAKVTSTDTTNRYLLGTTASAAGDNTASFNSDVYINGGALHATGYLVKDATDATKGYVNINTLYVAKTDFFQAKSINDTATSKHGIVALYDGGYTEVEEPVMDSKTALLYKANNSTSVAATPYMVAKSLVESKNYTDTTVAQYLKTVQAMQFKGTFAATVLNTSDSITEGTLYSKQEAGFTYRVGTSAKDGLLGNLEPGDLVICIANYDPDKVKLTTENVGTYFTVSQANIDGAVYGDLSGSGILLHTNGKGQQVSVLANGSNGQVLKIVNNVPTWSTDNNSYRAIQVGGTTFKATNNTDALNFAEGTGITLSSATASNVGTITISAKFSDASALTFTNGTASVAYKPDGAKTIRIGDGFTFVQDSTTETQYNLNHIGGSLTATTSNGARLFKYDKFGHITGTETAKNLTIGLLDKDSKTIGNDWTFNTSAAKTLKFKQGTNVTLSATTDGIITINSPDTHYATQLVAEKNKTAAQNSVKVDLWEGSGTLTSTDTKGSFTLKGGGHTKVSSANANNPTITITSDWRPIYLYKLSADGKTTTKDTITADSNMVFSQSFALNSASELDICWAEVGADGTITYTA